MEIRLPFRGEFAITMKFNEPCSWFKGGKHLGVDWACPRNTPLVAMFDGIVSLVENWQLKSYGRQINIRSKNSQFEALYAHCSSILKQPGDKVRIGEVIAYSGNSGFVISLGGGGYHLHFGLKKNGVWVDPLTYIGNEKQMKLGESAIDYSKRPKGMSKREYFSQVTGRPKEEYVEEKIIEVKSEDPITTGYIVKKGESLSSIAKDFYGDAKKWKPIYDYNKKVIGKNPDCLKIGIVLTIPPP